MRTIVGGVIGALALGVVMLGYSHRERGASGADLVRMPGAIYRDARGDLVSLRDGASSSSGALLGAPGASNGSVLVKCEAYQQAMVRQVRINGQDVSQVECVGQASAPVYVDPYGRPLPVMSAPATASDVRVVPAVSTYSAAYPAPRRAVRERRVAYRDAPERKSRRTWQKSALVIGGSAGAGAGVGAIAGGKKGALIGAAIGGGAASIYEAMKRR